MRKLFLLRPNSFTLLGILFTWCVLWVPSYAQNTPLSRPVSVYINWASYDELSDTVRLTEQKAIQQLNELVRWKKNGVQFDYYVMDAFWFEENGGYRIWRKNDWPNGYQNWIKKCQAHGIKPGLWFSTNALHAGGKFIMRPIPNWESSLTKSGKSLCLFKGGYLPHLMESLQMYVDAGIEMFKFDFADFYAITPELEGKMSLDEIRQANESALLKALSAFRKKNPHVLFVAYNGFGGEMSNTGVPISKKVNTQWLTVFDAMYCGDPRPADVPAFHFWRSKDIYSDHMVRYFRDNGLRLDQIDNSGFMIGKTGTCYFRGKEAWKGMALLSMARGGWLNTYYGNLELLSNEETQWFAKLQRLWYPIQKTKSIQLIGAIPGEVKPYGYVGEDEKGQLICLVNPSQTTQEINLHMVKSLKSKILFSDQGFEPLLANGKVKLGPEQVVMIGTGYYAQNQFDLGRGENITIPSEITPLAVTFHQQGNRVTGAWNPTQSTTYRIIFQQKDENGIPYRISGGSPPEGTLLNSLLSISVTQKGRPVLVQWQYGKAIWSGLSWASAEINPADVQKNIPLEVSFTSKADKLVNIQGKVYQVLYK